MARISNTQLAFCVALATACRRAPDRCQDDAAAQDWAAAVESCGSKASSDPDAALSGARAALYIGKFDRAWDMAKSAVLSHRSADAIAMLGYISVGREAPREAIGFLRIAFAMHETLGDRAGEARDAHQLAGAWFQIGEYGRALDAANLMHDLATQLRDARMIVYADLARTDVLRSLGELTAAEASLRDAADAATTPGDRVTVGLKQGILYIDAGHAALAAEPLNRALAIEQQAASPRPAMLQALWLNLGNVDRYHGDIPATLAKIENARKLGTDDMSYRLTRGRAFADAGRLDEAAAELAAAEAAGVIGKWTYEVPLERARVAARAGDIDAAIAADRRAIDRATALVSGASAAAPAVASYFREAHLHLIGLLARRGQWSDALEVVAALDAQAWLASRAPPTESRPTINELAEPPSRPALPHASASEIADAWRGRLLVIVVPDGERLWRLTVRDGVITGADLGTVAPLVALAHALESDPLAAEAGRTLGEALVPGDLPAGARLDLLLIGPIARAPLAALRSGDVPATQRWQLARALGVLPRDRAAARVAVDRVVVIGDPAGDLPASADEARGVARNLGGSLYVAAEATQAAFATARGASVLHVAAHTRLRGASSALQLADGDLTSTAIAMLDPPPRLVVLASCATAAGSDDTADGSLALAFVDAGAEIVIATQRSVRDGDAAQVMQAFYAAGGARDPIRALAAAQASLSVAPRDPSGAPPAWAAFEAIAGRPIGRGH